jgi:hypothetical protein
MTSIGSFTKMLFSSNSNNVFQLSQSHTFQCA